MKAKNTYSPSLDADKVEAFYATEEQRKQVMLPTSNLSKEFESFLEGNYLDVVQFIEFIKIKYARDDITIFPKEHEKNLIYLLSYELSKYPVNLLLPKIKAAYMLLNSTFFDNIKKFLDDSFQRIDSEEINYALAILLKSAIVARKMQAKQCGATLNSDFGVIITEHDNDKSRGKGFWTELAFELIDIFKVKNDTLIALMEDVSKDVDEEEQKIYWELRNLPSNYTLNNFQEYMKEHTLSEQHFQILEEAERKQNLPNDLNELRKVLEEYQAHLLKKQGAIFGLHKYLKPENKKNAENSRYNAIATMIKITTSLRDFNKTLNQDEFIKALHELRENQTVREVSKQSVEATLLGKIENFASAYFVELDKKLQPYKSRSQDKALIEKIDNLSRLIEGYYSDITIKNCSMKKNQGKEGKDQNKVSDDNVNFEKIQQRNSEDSKVKATNAVNKAEKTLARYMAVNDARWIVSQLKERKSDVPLGFLVQQLRPCMERCATYNTLNAEKDSFFAGFSSGTEVTHQKNINDAIDVLEKHLAEISQQAPSMFSNPF